MNVLVLIDEVFYQNQKSIISFDFVRQCDYLRFANHFGLESVCYQDINADSQIKGSFVQIENYHSSVPLKSDSYYYLNMNLLREEEMKLPDDNQMYIAKFDFKKIDLDFSESLFVKYTGIPHWLWPNTVVDWGLSSEELMIQKSGHYEITDNCHAILDDNGSQLLIVSYWDKENILSILQKDIEEISRYEVVVCVSAYLSHTVFFLLWWLMQRLPDGRIQLIHNNLADSNPTNARLLHHNEQFSLFILPLYGNRRDSGITTIRKTALAFKSLLVS